MEVPPNGRFTREIPLKWMRTGGIFQESSILSVQLTRHQGLSKASHMIVASCPMSYWVTSSHHVMDIYDWPCKRVTYLVRGNTAKTKHLPHQYCQVVTASSQG